MFEQNIPSEFYLLADDYVPYKCKFIKFMKGVVRPRTRYVLVEIEPIKVLSSKKLSCVVISACVDQSFSEIGKKLFFVDVCIPNEPETVDFDESKTDRFSCGRLYATYEDALKDIPQDAG
jgi:hypothetical protein